MSTPQQPGPATLAAVLGALNDTVDELKATKAEVKALKGEAEYLRAFGRHNRLFIIVDILLTILLSGVGALSVHAVQSAGQANSAQLALCQSGNTARGQQIALWEHVVAVSRPAPGSTKAQIARQKAQTAEFLTYIHQVFKSRDCNRLGR